MVNESIRYVGFRLNNDQRNKKGSLSPSMRHSLSNRCQASQEPLPGHPLIDCDHGESPRESIIAHTSSASLGSNNDSDTVCLLCDTDDIRNKLILIFLS